MPKLSKLTVLLFCLALIASSCASDNLDDLLANNSTVICDTSNVTFSGTISPLVTANCSIPNCHSGDFPASGYDFTTYEGLKVVVDKSRLFGVISHTPGFTPMPNGKPQLEQCDIDKVKAWIDAGAPND